MKSAPLELQDEVADSERTQAGTHQHPHPPREPCWPRAEPRPPAAGRKHMRQSTTEHTRQTFLRIQERQVQSKRKKGGPNYDRPLTQEELLEEAKITEEINLRSLGERSAGRGTGCGCWGVLSPPRAHLCFPRELRAPGGRQEEAGAEEAEVRRARHPVLVRHHAPHHRAGQGGERGRGGVSWGHRMGSRRFPRAARRPSAHHSHPRPRG